MLFLRDSRTFPEFRNCGCCSDSMPFRSQSRRLCHAFCNKVQNTEMVGGVVDLALKTADILSVVIIKDDKVGMGGRLEVTLL